MKRLISIVLLAPFAFVACASDSDNNSKNDGNLAGNAGTATSSGGASSAGRGGATTALGGTTTTSGGSNASGGTSTTGSGGSNTTNDCGGIAGLACGTGEFCNFALDAQCGAADQMGTCMAIPDACQMNLAPVCGCDGKTYSNRCVANSQGISVASDGEC